MIKITASTTLDEGSVLIKDEATYTPREAIKDSGFAGVGGRWMADGNPLTEEDLDKPFSQLGYGLRRNMANLVNVANSKCA